MQTSVWVSLVPLRGVGYLKTIELECTLLSSLRCHQTAGGPGLGCSGLHCTRSPGHWGPPGQVLPSARGALGLWFHCGANKPQAVWEPGLSKCTLSLNQTSPFKCDRRGGQAHLPGAGWSSYSTPQPAGPSASCPCPTVPAAFLVQRTMQTGPCTGTRGSLQGRAEQENDNGIWATPALSSACWAVALCTLDLFPAQRGATPPARAVVGADGPQHRGVPTRPARDSQRLQPHGKRHGHLQRCSRWLTGHSGRHRYGLKVSVPFSDPLPFGPPAIACPLLGGIQR